MLARDHVNIFIKPLPMHDLVPSRQVKCLHGLFVASIEKSNRTHLWKYKYLSGYTAGDGAFTGP